MKRKVTIQGVSGCYHDAAARAYFANDEVDTVACETFDDMFDRLKGDASLIGIMAIENTIAGSLLQNHELLRQSNLTVVGEYKMRISHVLCALPGQSIDNLTEVNSHPMALMQCGQYLHKHPNLKIVEKTDTAGSAREIAENHLLGHAAVCGKYAAELYGLHVLEEGIETNKRNFTRFLILADPVMAKELTAGQTIDKASLVFTLPHTQGSLAKILTIFSFYDINLSKIQSIPIIGREWEYRFFINLTFDDYVRYRQSIEAVRPLISDFKILGEYAHYE
ncbi:MAG TPA: prephenate dehydratase [Candidatus Limisoma intestinavium]|uniref:prephenate dehydratase n=1 Tax=Candidatus Limisoma intestinavium TaxID=2840856 RepID=A0A9D1LGR7_9BACT|nr:prephenate dehydratase [Candidatus Limisoma intestinavium]